MPISKCYYEMFGETALSLTHAAKPDITVLSYYFVVPNAEYFEMNKQLLRFRMGASNVFFHASNTRYVDNRNFNEINYLTLESNYVLNTLNNQDSNFMPHLFNALTSDSCDHVYCSIISKLQENVCLL
ncbi:MAG: hypothetical protein FWF80_09020 [Defluviitaleaceae bacterium]|nr:hypothetical protein [Defluviitaleaceae bacterium]